MYVACEGLSDLGNGPNKPTATATIIGEYSTSSHDGALLYSGFCYVMAFESYSLEYDSIPLPDLSRQKRCFKGWLLGILSHF